VTEGKREGNGGQKEGAAGRGEERELYEGGDDLTREEGGVRWNRRAG
jgi:hypothetical protein